MPLAGVVLQSRSQIANSVDFFATGSPHWTDLNADGSLANAGVLIATVTVGMQAYLTAYNVAGASLSGLWRCADLSNPTWSLIASEAAAEAAFGYDGTFGSLCVGPANQVLAYFNGGSGATGGGVWIGGATGGSFCPLPLYGTYKLYSFTPDENLHTAWGDSDYFYIGCGGTPPRRPGVAYTPDGTSWDFINFADVTNGAVQAMGVTEFKYAISHAFIEAWRDLNPLQKLSYSPSCRFGIGGNSDDYTDFIFLLHNQADLRRSDAPGTIIRTAAAQFGSGTSGGMARFVPTLEEYIVWVCATTSATEHKIVAMRDDEGTWTDKTGDFYSAVGDWPGQGNGFYGNVFVRPYGPNIGGDIAVTDPHLLNLRERSFGLRLQ